MPTSSSYHLTEARPQVGSAYIHISRGGAGNVASTSSTASGPDVTDPASRPPSLNSRKPKVFMSGRGGAGNLHHSSERAIFSFDEELEQQMRQMQDLAPVYHVGRGGAGNKAYPRPSRRIWLDTDTDSTSSGSTLGSEDAGFGGKIRRRWAIMTEHL